MLVISRDAAARRPDRSARASAIRGDLTFSVHSDPSWVCVDVGVAMIHANPALLVVTFQDASELQVELLLVPDSPRNRVP
ncbi:unnamed protein product [Brassica rapa subsp. narinosa]